MYRHRLRLLIAPRLIAPRLIAVLLGGLLLLPAFAPAERVKDLAVVSGVRSNQLVGYGLVVGLDGTGDQTTQTPFTVQSITNMLEKFGVTIPANVSPQLKNVAAVTVTAQLPPFIKVGQTIDVTVGSIGNANSLRGGDLLMTPLRGADGEVYAMAQGSVVVAGFGVSGKDGSRVSVNVPSGGRVPNGATVEHEVRNDFASQPFVMLNLNTPDFTTATHLSTGINQLLGGGHRGGARPRIGKSGRARRCESAHRVRVGAAGTGDRAGRSAGPGDHQFTHRHRGDRLARARDCRRRSPTAHCRSRSPSARMSASPMPSATAPPRSRRARISRSAIPRRACSCSTPA
jgi:hypothetical protein